MFISAGEFGIVYKAHLVKKEGQTGLETGWKSKAVAVKLLKGIEMITEVDYFHMNELYMHRHLDQC